ncbi:cation:dicarboxylase symporter family transporter [Vibrio lentus]|nr:cation:dicarboxylase symporter family transporter [Vibrio lentus]
MFALDRIFDMIRTALNITGDAACAVIVDSLIKDEEQEAELTKTVKVKDETLKLMVD